MCPPMPTCLYTRWDLNSETGTFTPRQNKANSFKKLVMSSFQQTRPECKIESFFATGRERKIDSGFHYYCNVLFKAMVGFCQFCRCQEVRPFLTGEDI